jgi:hypothetical protein
MDKPRIWENSWKLLLFAILGYCESKKVNILLFLPPYVFIHRFIVSLFLYIYLYIYYGLVLYNKYKFCGNRAGDKQWPTTMMSD